MTAFGATGSSLASAAATATLRGDTAGASEGLDAAAQRFSDSLANAAVDPAQATTSSVSAPVDLDANERARRALQLGEPQPSNSGGAGSGDAILNGLQKLRGVFDAQHARLNDVMAGPVDTGSLMKMQMEVVNFSVLVDVASKLTGKSTQAFETLLKGQ